MLSYRFPIRRTSAFDGSVTVYGGSLLYRFDIQACETVIRNDRQSDLSINASAVFDCRIPMSGGEDLIDQESIGETGLSTVGHDLTLEMLTREFEITCDAGEASYEYELSETGLIRRNSALGETHSWGWEDRYDQASTLAEVAAQPSTLTMRNGALLARPAAAPILESANGEWLVSMLSAMLPPLPEGPIQPGVSWTAGSMVPATMFAEVPLMRYRAQWLTYDHEHNRARIAWKGDSSGTALIPRPGIHHIGTDAVAAIEVTGFIVLDLDTGTVLSGRIHTESEIAHVRSSQVKVRFRADITICPQTVDDPEASEQDPSPQAVIATFGEDDDDEPGESHIDQ